MADDPKDPAQLGNIVTNLPAVRAAKTINPNSRAYRRLVKPIGEDEADNQQRLSFQHTVFCQTGLPYRNPGDEVRQWQHEQGAMSLRVEAGAARHPKTGQWLELGLPWGIKLCLILAHLNAEALRQNSPEIEVQGSPTAFVKCIRGFHRRGTRKCIDPAINGLEAMAGRLPVIDRGAHNGRRQSLMEN